MRKGVKLLPGGGIRENTRGQGLPVHGAVRAYDVSAERADNIRICRSARRQHAPGNLIGINNARAEIP